MNPILLVHGYSAESKSSSSANAVTQIYGSFPAALRKKYAKRSVSELNVSRYISLEDGVTLDDLATAMENALRNEFQHLLDQKFDVIIHSTGALVVRNWLRRFSPKPSPIDHLIYLAGANFGSGWAHVGKGQLAKWGRFVFQRGTERGVQVLHALELGSDEMLDLHRYFLADDNNLLRRYRVREFCITGSQVMRSWLPIPVRYAHEDGSDGVVRVASCNVNMNYVHVRPKRRAYEISWEEIGNYCKLMAKASNDRVQEPNEYYRVAEQSLVEDKDRERVPFAIPFECAHTGDSMGVVTGKSVRKEVMNLLDISLNVTTVGEYRRVADKFERHTLDNYAVAAKKLKAGFIKGLFNEPRQQYDPHAQVIFRLRDQFGNPVEHFDVFFDSYNETDFSINQLFEHSHTNNKTDGIITFYLRVGSFDDDSSAWKDQLQKISGVHLEIVPTEPQTEDIQYLPLCLTISGRRLRRIIQPHRTSIIDVTLLRLPSPEVFRILTAKV